MRVLCWIGYLFALIFGGVDLVAGSLAMLWALMARDALTLLMGLGVVSMAACMIMAVNEVRQPRPP